MQTQIPLRLSWGVGFRSWLESPMICSLRWAHPLLPLICGFARMCPDIWLKVALISGLLFKFLTFLLRQRGRKLKKDIYIYIYFLDLMYLFTRINSTKHNSCIRHSLFSIIVPQRKGEKDDIFECQISVSNYHFRTFCDRSKCYCPHNFKIIII